MARCHNSVSCPRKPCSQSRVSKKSRQEGFAIPYHNQFDRLSLINLPSYLLKTGLLFLCVGLFGYAEAQIEAPITLVDDQGATTVLARPAQRIVSLLPSITESVCALGACERLIGTDQFSNSPASVLALPKLGGLDDTQIERIVALRPDVVLTSTSARAGPRLRSLGLKVVTLEARNHADVKRSLDFLAKMLGAPAAAANVWSRIEQDMQTAAQQVPQALRGKLVYFEVDATPYAAGAASFIGETLTRLGLGNAVPAELGPFPKLNPEYVVRTQPDIVMADARSLAAMPKRPGWAALHALQYQQSCGFSGSAYELLIRPGPRMGEAALVMAQCLSKIHAVEMSPNK
jgi:iron complex transport system substrate-binding protein